MKEINEDKNFHEKRCEEMKKVRDGMRKAYEKIMKEGEKKD